MFTIQKLKALGFAFDDFGFHSLAICCGLCRHDRRLSMGVVIASRRPDHERLSAALRRLADQHGCEHATAALRQPVSRPELTTELVWA